jgi:putative glutamine amidotransferase
MFASTGLTHLNVRTGGFKIHAAPAPLAPANSLETLENLPATGYRPLTRPGEPRQVRATGAYFLQDDFFVAPHVMSTAKPLIGIPACRKYIAPHMFHAVGEKYIAAVATAAGGVPLLIPALGGGLAIGPVLRSVDGLLFTGSPSNVEPHHYQGKSSEQGTLHDPHRDATTLPLMAAAIAAGVPVFAICRGFQEMNVVFGGSLHQKVQDVPGKMDHREDPGKPLDEQYAPAHELHLSEGGKLHELLGTRRIDVNSLHSQGVDRLGEGLVVEATAPDGLVEAFRVADASAFALAVQWHPEWQVMKNPQSVALFEAFGDACRQRASETRSHDVDSAVV